MLKRSDIEIMAPVGSYESLAAAIAAGADSVYFGVGHLNMRARSSVNFTPDDLTRIVRTAQESGLKTYLTVNTVLYDDEIDAMHAIVDRALAEGVDAVIAADQAAVAYARGVGMEVHISTQLNVSNVETLKFYSQWADVVVLARELTLPQVERIHNAITEQDIRGPKGELVRIEMFAHGALCMAVSGRCYLSLHDAGCSANRGACRQVCRRSYTLADADTGARIAAEGRYLLSPRDLCTVEYLDRMIAAGVRVLKIEGRARPAEYVKRVCECYNEALDAILAGTYSAEFARGLTDRLRTVFNRGFWEGYYLGGPTVELSGGYGSSATRRKVYVGRVVNFFKNISVAEVLVEASPLESGSDLLVTGHTTGALEMDDVAVRVDNTPVDTAPQGSHASFATTVPVRRGDSVFKMVDAPAG